MDIIDDLLFMLRFSKHSGPFFNNLLDYRDPIARQFYFRNAPEGI
jgi:hypothetical protein